MLTIKRIMKNKRKEKRSCRLILACCALLLFISVNAFAQQQVTVTGNVKDEKGEPIIGANVIVKGTGTGKCHQCRRRLFIGECTEWRHS